MVPKADLAPLEQENRFAFIREIFAIILGLFAIITMVALVSDRAGQQWVGPVGAFLTAKLDFVFGRFVVFVAPVMLGITAIQLFVGGSPSVTKLKSYIRGIGGLLVLVSVCALFTLAAGPDDPVRSFQFGGLIGNMLLDPKGLDLARWLGGVGSGLTFSGLLLVGLILFTEKLLRDFASMLSGGFRNTWAWLAARRWFAWLGFLRIFHPRRGLDAIVSIWHGFLGLQIPRRVMGFLNGISFSEHRRERVFGGSPIIEISHGSSAERRQLVETPAAAPADSRSSSAFRRQPVEAPAAAAPRVQAPVEEFEFAQPKAAPRVVDREDHDDDLGIAIESPPPELNFGKAHHARVEPVQDEMNLFPSEFQLPSLDLLVDPPETVHTMSDTERERLSRKIESVLAEFKVEVEVLDVVEGPVIIRFALRVAPGVRVNKILALESELAMALKAQHVRILAPIPGQSAVGIEVPKKKANAVMLKELLISDEYQHSDSPLSFALGKNIAGETIACDLAKMPHLLIAGATGSGKSVCLNTIIASLLFRNKPDKVKFIMIDPKRVELSIYQAIPHLWAPVVCETKKAAAALAWCVEQMEKRYETLQEVGVRNIDGYNALMSNPTKRSLGVKLEFMPHVVIIIDELADLMVVAKNEVEEYIIRLAQMARAVGMHLILATQRPSVNVITGIIKANFPSRIAFQVSSKVDSRTILDMNGAESLMGRGDMLYSPGGAKPFRIQGAFVSDAEVERLADYIRDQERARYAREDFEVQPTPAERAKAQRTGEEYDEDYDGDWDDSAHAFADSGNDDFGAPARLATRGRAGTAPLAPGDVDAMTDEELFMMALRLVLETGKGSVSYIQRRMKIGYARAGRIMDILEEHGIVGPYQGSKPRDVLVDKIEYLRKLDNGELRF